MDEINQIEKNLKLNNSNPRDIKLQLAKEIISIYYSKDSANKAQENWEKTFSKKETPEDVLEIKVKKEEPLINVLVENKIITSKTDFRRLVGEGAITNLDTDEKIKDNNVISLPGTYRIGKKRFVKIVNY
jgi:tyrosyl-tRNA synthetase